MMITDIPRERVDAYSCTPQQLIKLTRANTTIVIGGRGSAKSTDTIATRSIQLVESMPRSTQIIYFESFKKGLKDIMPQIALGWARNKVYENVHYTARKAPPESWGWPKPLRVPWDESMSIFWCNGAVSQMMSDDVFNNGVSAQGLLGDEARTFKEQNIRQVRAAMRDDSLWKGNPDYMALMLCSDQPWHPHEKWLFNWEKEQDEEQNFLIVQHQLLLDHYLIEFFTPGTTATRKKKLNAEINKLNEILRVIRKDSVQFVEMSTLDNLYAVGEDFINNQKRELSVEQFNVMILNKRKGKPPRSFYVNFNKEHHTYLKYNYSHLNSLEINLSGKYEETCKQDGDLIFDEPLDVAVDAGGHINVCVTGQDQGDVYRVLKGLHVTGKEKIEELAELWCNYYRFHKTKDVRFIYDQTDIPETSVSDEVTAEKWMKVLRSNDWTIQADYVGPVTHPMERFNKLNEILAEKNPDYKPLKINKGNCEKLIISLEGAETKPNGKTGYEKEKKYEANLNLDQSETTHYSDAFDKLVYHAYHSPRSYSTGGGGSAIA